MPMPNFFEPSFTGDLRRAKLCCGERTDGMWGEKHTAASDSRRFREQHFAGMDRVELLGHGTS